MPQVAAAVVLSLLTMGVVTLSALGEDAEDSEDPAPVPPPKMDLKKIEVGGDAAVHGPLKLDVTIRETQISPPANAKHLEELFLGKEVEQIKISRYSQEVFPVTSDVVKVIEQSLTLEIETPMPFISWEEVNGWYVICKFKFKGGGTADMYTDGMHYCYKNVEGSLWFFRIAPIEIANGYRPPYARGSKQGPAGP